VIDGGGLEIEILLPLAAVPLAASIARLRTRSRRLSEPRSKRPTRLEMIDSMSASLARKMDFGTEGLGTEDLGTEDLNT
jgi:hypothetical protein